MGSIKGLIAPYVICILSLEMSNIITLMMEYIGKGRDEIFWNLHKSGFVCWENDAKWKWMVNLHRKIIILQNEKILCE